MSLKKKIIVIVTVLLLIFGLTRLFGKKSSAPQYQTSTVERGTLISSVSSSGTVSSGNKSQISTGLSGTITNVYVKNGETVTKGQAIATIAPDPDSVQKQAAAYASYLGAQNSLNSAKAKMNSLQASLFQANQAFMNDKGVGNPSEDQKKDPKYIEENATWLQAEADYNNQQGVIAQAEASFTSAALSYSLLSSTIAAPVSGTIANLTITEGSKLTNTSSSSSNNSSTNSQSVGTIDSGTTNTTAVVNLTEIDIVKIKIGQKVTMTLDAFPDKTFTGKVSIINTEGSVSSGVTTYPTTITFDSAPDTIYPNMAVNATIITSVKNDVLVVPNSAVQTSNGTSTVRVLKNGQATPVDVEIGSTSDTQTEIVSGLSEGDQVIIGTTIQGASTGAGTTSPFGGTGFGGARAVGGFGGGNQIRIQRR